MNTNEKEREREKQKQQLIFYYNKKNNSTIMTFPAQLYVLSSIFFIIKDRKSSQEGKI